MVPTSDQLFKFDSSGKPFWTVLPNLILFPHLPWWITSPANGKSGWILFLPTKVACDKLISLFKSIPVSSSVTLLTDPADVCV